jgi:hypothetical protein
MLSERASHARNSNMNEFQGPIESSTMRLPRFHLRTLVIAVAVVGLIIGDYFLLTRQMNGPHSYGFPGPLWQLMLLSLMRVAFEVLVLGLAYGAIRVGWRTLAPLLDHRSKV